MDNERAMLGEERDFLLAALEDLEAEREAGELTEADYVALRARYERRAVTILSNLVTGHPPQPEEIASGESAPYRGTSLRRPRGVLVAFAVAAVALGAGVVVDGSAGNRLATQTITGSVPPALGNDLINAQAAMAKGDQLQALKLFEAVLATQPNEPEALAYWGWIVANAGEATGKPAVLTRGITSIEAAVRVDPSYPDAHLLLGLALLGSGDAAGAATELRHFLALGPPPQEVRAAEAALAKAEAATRSRQGPAAG